MNSKKLLSYGALGIGILIFIIGAGLVMAYISEAILARLGEPDQSLLFWYLPLLFIGIMGIIIGLAAGILGIIGLRRGSHPAAHNVEPTVQ